MMHPMIEAALATLPPPLLQRSGAAFYSASPAFSRPSPVYLLGLNPGGNPEAQAGDTLARSLTEWRSRTEPYSSYVDEIWEGSVPGEYGIQPRIRHLLGRLDLDPRLTPSSNVVFARTRDEAALGAEKQSLLEACWPIHEAVIEALDVTVLICLGQTAGRWAREMLNANEEVASFTEDNARRWTSLAHRSQRGVTVCTLTHPARVDWRNPASDPSPMMIEVLR